jgi:hypothetical protein
MKDPYLTIIGRWLTALDGVRWSFRRGDGGNYLNPHL